MTSKKQNVIGIKRNIKNVTINQKNRKVLRQ